MKDYKRQILSIALLAGVSGIPFLQRQINDSAESFAHEKVIIQKDTMDMQQFYEQLSYSKSKGWLFEDKKGKQVPLDSLADFKIVDSLHHQVFLSREMTKSVDTVNVRYAQKIWSAKEQSNRLVFALGAHDSLAYMPSLGIYDYGNISIREFVASNDYLQDIVDKYNDKYNCTTEHEEQHFYNSRSGVNRAGQSYENKFVENCLDEVSASVRQLIAQRKNYIKNNRDPSFITIRFPSYKKAIEDGKFAAVRDDITEEEVAFIANGVFDEWVENKFDLYKDRNQNRTVYHLSKTNYNGIQPNQKRHDELLKKMFDIEGIDFYPYIAEKEYKLRDKIPEDMKKVFLMFKKMKFASMNPLDKLEQLRIEEGKNSYNAELTKNKALSSVYKIFAREKNR